MKSEELFELARFVMQEKGASSEVKLSLMEASKIYQKVISQQHSATPKDTTKLEREIKDISVSAITHILGANHFLSRMVAESI